ncbi:MAG TPA: O-antigen polymerase [Candidatus Udaeobacter sp.]
MILSISASFDVFLRSAVANELTFYLAALMLVVLTAESCIRLLKRDSFGITLGVYVTVFAWYFVDPMINPEEYNYLPSSALTLGYGQVLLFLIGFRVVVPAAARWILSRRSTGVVALQRMPPEQILIAVGTLWLLLFALGIYRMGGDVIGAVFPVDSRSGMTMFLVGGSASDFLINAASYLFSAVTAFLGMLVFFQRTTFWRILAGAMFAMTLPYYFLSGTRSGFVAVALPFIITYLFYGRHLLILKLAILAVAFFCLKEGFKFVQVFRISGFREVLAVKNPYELMDEDVQTVGLNMIGELCFVNAYLDSGETSPAYGGRYLNELLNFIPRTIWPSKPLLGIDYAIWRGFESDTNDLGVNTTVATGMIGGGVLNFGKILGPVAAGILMAVWSSLLIRWWEQRKSLLRLALFMLGIGLTFNLGRDITLLVLWPVVFAYFFVRLVEIWATKRFGRLPQAQTVASPSAGQLLAGQLTQ